MKQFKDNKKTIRKEIALCILSGIFTLIAYIVINKLWNYDITVPFVYNGDSLGLISYVSYWIAGKDWSNILSGGPYGTNMWLGLNDASLHNIFLWLLAKITRSIGITVNVGCIATYFLSAVCTCISLRLMGVSEGGAVSGGVIYAFIPSRAYRMLAHYNVGGCYAIPLAVVAIYYLMDGTYCKQELAKKKKITIRDVVKSGNDKLLFGFFAVLITTLLTVYYGFLIMVFMTFALIYVLVETKQLRHVYYYIINAAGAMIGVVVTFLPQKIASMSTNVIVDNNATRFRGDVEVYGLKLASMLLPITGHRIGLLANLRNRYDSGGFPLINENNTATLGLVMSIGFIVCIISVFFSYKNKNDKITKLGRLNIVCFCVSVIGGVASIIGLFFYSIRCYNRVSFIIGAVSVIVFMVSVDAFLRKHIKKGKVLCYVVYTAIAVIALFDQTTGSGYSKEYNEAHATPYKNMIKFVRDVEEYEGKDAQILVGPICEIEYSLEGVHVAYENQLPRVFAEDSNWYSDNSNQNGQFIRSILDEHDIELTVTQAKRNGINGLAVYMPGYTWETYRDMSAQLHEFFGDPDVVCANGNWEYYSFKGDLKKIIEGRTYNILLSGDRWNADKYILSGISGSEYNFTWTEGSELETGSLYLSKGEHTLTMNYLTTFNGKQGVKIYINDVLKYDGNVEGEGSIEVKFANLDVDEVKVRMEFPDAVSPAALNGGEGDSRALALALTKIDIN